MLYAVISDIHGNFPALQAVLDDAAKAGAEQYLFLGDLITDQPYTREIIQAVQGLPHAVVVSGNRERYMGRLDPAERHRQQAALLFLTEEQLGEDGLRWVQELPTSVSLKTPDGEKIILLEHICEEINGKLHTGQGTRRLSCGVLRDEYWGTSATHLQVQQFAREFLEGNPRLAELKARSGADVVLHGHNHMQYAVETETMLLLNPGAAGNPCDHQSGAPYTLLRYENGRFSVEERRVTYDVEKAVAAYRSSAFYRESPPWCELVIQSMLSGKDYHGVLFRHLSQEQKRLEPKTDEEHNLAFQNAFRLTKEEAGF